MTTFMPHERGFKQRTYPTSRQVHILSRYFGSRRFVYNWGLAKCNEHYAETQKHPEAHGCVDSPPGRLA